MSGPSRPTQPHGSPVVLTSEERGGGLADRPSNQSGPDSACGTRGALLSPAADSRGSSHTRSSRSPRRSSSGYFSSESESLPGSPVSRQPPTADALRSVAEVHGREESAHRRQHGQSSSGMWPLNDPRDMQAVLVGRELRQRGDEYNRLLTERRQAHRPLPLPQVRREPTIIICMGLLLFLFGRLLYSHGSTFSQSQV